jgi:alpha-ketoglutarate-dependent taurine dioxygenase
MKNIQPLTLSGIGIQIEGPDAFFFSKENIEAYLAKHHFIVLRKLNWTTDQLHKFLEQFGELVRNEKRENETMLAMDGKRIATEVIRGNGRLPLHRDGLLMNTVVKYVAIMCMQSDVTKGGRTYLSDSGSAWNEFPTEIKEALTGNGIEGMPFDVTYYLKNEAKWYPFPGTFEHNGKTFPNGG